MLQRVAAEEKVARALTGSQAHAVAGEVQRRLHRQVQKLCLSRGGLAETVAALGNPRLVSHGSPQQRAAAIADALFHSPGQIDAMVAAAAARARAARADVAAVVPEMLAAQFARLSQRAQVRLEEMYCRMPSLSHLSQGSLHADIADIVRRRCGAGPYGRVVLRRRLRQVLGEASGFRARGLTAWYVGQVLHPAQAVARGLQRMMLRK